VGGLGAVSTSGSGSRGMEPPENNKNMRGDAKIAQKKCLEVLNEICTFCRI